MEEFCARQRALLDLEKQAEAQQLQEKLAELTGHQCQLEGISLLNLNLVSSHTSLFGKLSLQLANHKHQQLAKSQFKVGDEVVLYNPKHKNTKDHEEVQGIVSKVTTHTIELVHSDDGGHNATSMFDAITNLRLDLTSSEATHKKMLATLDSMQQHKHTDNILTDLLFNNSDQNSFWKHKLITPNATRSALVASNTFNKSLNASQIRAINVSLDSNYVSIIHGPPGTGKTSTVVELIIQTLKGGSGKKLLVCAPSNVAVDNILERLVTFGGAVKPVRMGHPARVSDKVLAHCLDSLVASHDGTEIAGDVRREIDALMKASAKSGARDFSARRLRRQEIGALRKEVRKREEDVVKSIIAGCNVVLCTCVGAATRVIRDIKFDLAIVDEAAQALEAACWIPILKASKVVLAGDHKQLAPTVKSSEAAAGGLATTLFERIISHGSGLFGDCIVMLDTQYRMNESISSWASSSSYNNELKTAASCRDISLADYPFAPAAAPLPPMLLLNTAHCEDCGEEAAGEGSHSNRFEATLVATYVHYLLQCGVRPRDIGIVTPYNGQLELLRSLIFDGPEDTGAGRVDLRLGGLEIRTVDGFQGGEKEVIILSLVRSNKHREVGFLADERRINVAVTRAKRNVTVICDVETITSNSFLNGLVRHIMRLGSHRNVVDYRDVFDPSLDDVSFANGFREILDPSFDDCVCDSDGDAKSNSGKNAEKNRPKKVPQKCSAVKVVAQVADFAAKRAAEEVGNDIFTENFKSFLTQCRSSRALSLSHRGIAYDRDTKTFCFDDNTTSTSAGVLTFPTVLSSNERRLMHIVCDEWNVSHRSRSSDSNAEERFLEVSFSQFSDDRGPMRAMAISDTAKKKNPKVKIAYSTDLEDNAGQIKEVNSKLAGKSNGIVNNDDNDDEEEEEEDDTLLTTTLLTCCDKKKGKKNKKKKGSSNRGAGALPISAEPLDDMALLDEEIRRNSESTSYNKLRLGCAPIPNYEKKLADDRLRDKIAASQVLRKGDSGIGPQGSTKKKKVANKPKKPPLTLAELRERRVQRFGSTNDNDDNDSNL